MSSDLINNPEAQLAKFKAMRQKFRPLNSFIDGRDRWADLMVVFLQDCTKRGFAEYVDEVSTQLHRIQGDQPNVQKQLGMLPSLSLAYAKFHAALETLEEGCRRMESIANINSELARLELEFGRICDAMVVANRMAHARAA